MGYLKKNISDIGYFVIDILPMRKSEMDRYAPGKKQPILPTAWPAVHSLDSGGFLKNPENGGTPIAGWFIRENPIYQWMIWGYP